MGNKSSSTEDDTTEKDKRLGDEILKTIISELQVTMEASEAKKGKEKSDYEKKIKEILTQEKFTDYRKLVEEAKDQKLRQMRTEQRQLKIYLEENKQKIETITKEKQDLEEKLNKKLLDHEKTIRDMKEKYNKTEKILNSERDVRISLEKNVMEINTLKMDLQAQTKKTEDIQRELDNTRGKLLDKTKINLELQTQLKLGEISSSNVLRDTIDKQNAIIKQVQENLNNTQKKLDQELTNKRDNLIKYEMEKQFCMNLKREKESLFNNLRTLQENLETEITRNKINFEEQAKKLQDVTEKLTAAQKTTKLQVKLKKKAQAELSFLEEKTRTIKQLEIKLHEKDRIISEYVKQTENKPEEKKEELTEDQIEAETSNFLKMSEEARVKELKMKDLELNKTKSNYESELQEQLKRFNRSVYKLKMTEKRRDELQQLWKNAEGKLILLESSHKDIKQFCDVELKGRKHFLTEFQKLKQESNKNSRNVAQASTSSEAESFLNEKMVLDTQLDSKTNEIALLKQQLKLKETEIQNMASEGHSENRKREMEKLHEEFKETLDKFNQKD